MSHPGYLAFYIVGITAASFHLGNGLWNFACKWGIAVSARVAASRWLVWRRGDGGAHVRRHRNRARLPQPLVPPGNLRPMRHPKIIIVGGGLAGLMAAIRVAEARRACGTFFDRAREALAFRLRAGRDQRRKKSERRRRFHLEAFRRHDLRRRFPRQPAAGERHVRGRACHHRFARSHGRDVQSHARRLARFPTIRRHALSTALLLPAPPPDSNSSTRSTSKSGAPNPKTK